MPKARGDRKRAKNKNVLKPGKNPKNQFSPAPHKTPVSTANPHAYKRERPVWRVRKIDRDGPWPISADTLAKILLPKLHDFESMTWAEIEAAVVKGKKSGHRAHHSMSVADLPPKTQERFQQIRLDEWDTIFRFRLGNKPRLWGIRSNNIFKLVWYDPEHEVCPTEQ